MFAERRCLRIVCQLGFANVDGRPRAKATGDEVD